MKDWSQAEKIDDEFAYFTVFSYTSQWQRQRMVSEHTKGEVRWPLNHIPLYFIGRWVDSTDNRGRGFCDFGGFEVVREGISVHNL